MAGGSLALLLGGLVGCGGGGGAALPVAPAVVDLGTVSATQVTVASRTFSNPLGVAATATEPTPGGAFRIDPGSLPVLVAAGADVTLPVLLTPPAHRASRRAT